jgi:hypothetical protein
MPSTWDHTQDQTGSQLDQDQKNFQECNSAFSSLAKCVLRFIKYSTNIFILAFATGRMYYVG